MLLTSASMLSPASAARTVILACICLLCACSSTSELNPTTPQYQINEEALQKKPLKKLVIATTKNSGEPTRYHMQDTAMLIHAIVTKYLQAHRHENEPNIQS